MYEPAEDSYLLQKYVKKYAEGKVLDIGTGSGIQATTAAKKKNVDSVLAVDIDNDVISSLKKEIKKKKNNDKITLRESDLFSNVMGKFDTIIFNPPYLPDDENVKDSALYGGKQGYEILEQFISEVSDYLNESGIVLIVFSSLTKKEKVDQAIEGNLLKFEELDSEKLFFEKLYCYKVWKSDLLRTLQKKGVKNIHYFNRGKRGTIYTGNYRSKKIAIKTKRKESLAVNRLENEAKWLKVLNKKGIGPSLLFSDTNYIVYSFVEGEFILDYFEKNSKEKIKRVLKNLFEQCYVLDQLQVQKEEMHRPIKHVLIGKKITMLDFERCYARKNPHNVTQFVEFVCRIKKLLKKKGFSFKVLELRKLAKGYSNNKSKNNLHNIIKKIQ